jgi:ABC-2 type transport system permease protein
VIKAIVEQLVFGEAVRVVLPEVARRDPLIRNYLTNRTQPKPDAPVNDHPAEAPANYGNVVYQVLVPSYAVLFAFFLINIMARSFISERQSGTLQRIGLAPVGAASVVLGKTVPFLLVSIAQGLLLLLFGKLIFGMSWGSMPWMLLPVVICTSLAATALGLLTAVLVRTDAQVSAYANLLVIGLGGISGCFMPRQWLPELMRQVSLATPHAWSLIAYDQLLTADQPDLPRVWRSCGALVVFAAVFLAVGWHRFRTTR